MPSFAAGLYTAKNVCGEDHQTLFVRNSTLLRESPEGTTFDITIAMMSPVIAMEFTPGINSMESGLTRQISHAQEWVDTLSHVEGVFCPLIRIYMCTSPIP